MPDTNPYPSRRELRLKAQKEAEERAQREAWERQRREAQAQRVITETAAEPAQREHKHAAQPPVSRRARRASQTPTDAPTLQNPQVEPAEAAHVAESGPLEQEQAPLTRREARKLREQQEHLIADSQPDEDYGLTTESFHSDDFTEDASEITAVSSLNTIELERERLAKETQKLAEEIAEAGRRNPQAIDVKLLARQQELAAKSKRLNELEEASTTSIQEVDEPVADHGEENSSEEPLSGLEASAEEETAQEPNTDDLAVEDVPDEQEDEEELAVENTDEADAATEPVSLVGEQQYKPAHTPSWDEIMGAASSTIGERHSGSVASKEQTTDQPKDVPEPADHSSPERGNIKAVQGTQLSDDFSTSSQAPERGRSVETTGRQEPVGASDAHGLDPLEAKDSTAWERKVLLASTIFAIIGLAALIIGVIMITSS